jgi:elongation factor P
MIPGNAIRTGMIIRWKDDLYRVTYSMHRTPGNLRGFVQTKLKSITSGRTDEYRFASEEKVDKVDLEGRDLEYLYADAANHVFMDPDSFEQFTVDGETLGGQAKFLQPNMRMKVDFYEGRPVAVDFPQKVTSRVVETTPSVKNASATNQTKPATLENGVVVQVPHFIKEGDEVLIDTETAEYLERARQG